MSAASALLQGLVPMMNTPNSAPASALQSIGTVCWPFQRGMQASCDPCAATSHWSRHANKLTSTFPADPDLSLVVPPLPPGLLADVKPQDFNLYKQRFASRLARFEVARNSQFVPRVDSEDFIPGMCCLDAHLHMHRNG